MIYPMDPQGPFGQEYPKGFLKWYMAVVVAVVVLGFVFLPSCTPAPNHGDVMLNACAEATHSNVEFDDCMFKAVTAICPLPDEEAHWEACVKEAIK
jgi:hypothetical protein